MPRLSWLQWLVIAASGTVWEPAGAQVLDAKAAAALDAFRAEVGEATASASPVTGRVRFLRLSEGASAVATKAMGAAGAEAKALAFLDAHGAIFGIEDAARELRYMETLADLEGGQHVTYEQVHEGVPVFAGNVRVHFDHHGRLAAINGSFVPGLDFRPLPRVSPGEAEGAALLTVARAQRGDMTPALVAAEPRLLVYHAGLAAGRPGPVYLAWEIEVRDQPAAGAGGVLPAVREWVYVDAVEGEVIDRLPGLFDQLERRVYRGDSEGFTRNLIWQEGDRLPYRGGGSPAHDAGINRLIELTGDTYRFFANLSGGTYLGYDNAAGTFRAVYEGVDGQSCPNAFWNGSGTFFCANTVTDDVVTHEWTHAYTEHTHNLIFRWQPGALNEAYSDIFGEVIDQLNATGTDGPAPPRAAGACSTFGVPMTARVKVLAPAAIARTMRAAQSRPGPGLGKPLSGELALVENTVMLPRNNACTKIENPSALLGKIALVERQGCATTVKLLNLQKAGAIGAIFHNLNNDDVVVLSGSDPKIRIPSVAIGRNDALLLKKHLAKGVRVELAGTRGSDPSLRWLVGEDKAGPGFAFRDMWEPNCMENPGRVGDVSYYCAAGDGDDAGGVHRNSGVPNHAFALLVDGGTFNGRTVRGIGLTKAAHVYWRAMRYYQHRATDFADHADALEQACAELAAAGTTLADLRTGGASGEVLTADDCAQLAAALAAVEMRRPIPCPVRPILDPHTPPLCPAGVAQPFFVDDFESGAAGWSVETDSTTGNCAVWPQVIACPPRPDDRVAPWALVSDLPDGRPGSAHYAPMPAALTHRNPQPCPPGVHGYQVKRLISPPFTVPSGAGGPRVAFTHWIGTPGFPSDGGNLKVSVNGGPYQVVPPAAFRFNAYNRIPTPPLSLGILNWYFHSEPGWTGTNGRSSFGSWGQSQIDLSSFAKAGDRVQLRFDFATRGCDELARTILGWYLDDVKAYTCGAATLGALP